MNVVLLLVILGAGLVAVMCLDFQWLRSPSFEFARLGYV